VSGEFVQTAALTSRYVVALVFVTAAIPKLTDRRELERAIGNYALLPRAVVRPVATWLPRVELTCGIALLLGIAVVLVAVITGVLLLAFAAAVAVNLVRGRAIECGCYGSVAPRKIGWWLVGGNLVLAGVALAVAFGDPGTLALFRIDRHASSLSDEDAVAALFFAAVLVLAYLTASSWHALRKAETALLRAVGSAS